MQVLVSALSLLRLLCFGEYAAGNVQTFEHGDEEAKISASLFLFLFLTISLRKEYFWSFCPPVSAIYRDGIINRKESERNGRGRGQR